MQNVKLKTFQNIKGVKLKKLVAVFLSITLVFFAFSTTSCSVLQNPKPDNYEDVNQPVIGIA